MTTLMERAKLDAKDRERNKKTAERLPCCRLEFEEITKKASEFVSHKLDMEIAPDQLRHQTQTWLDNDELAWDLTVEGMEFEISRQSRTGRFSLHLILEAETRYIRRLADLATAKGSDG